MLLIVRFRDTIEFAGMEDESFNASESTGKKNLLERMVNEHQGRSVDLGHFNASSYLSARETRYMPEGDFITCPSDVPDISWCCKFCGTRPDLLTSLALVSLAQLISCEILTYDANHAICEVMGK